MRLPSIIFSEGKILLLGRTPGLGAADLIFEGLWGGKGVGVVWGSRGEYVLALVIVIHHNFFIMA